jgi:hypothetical protein
MMQMLARTKVQDNKVAIGKVKIINNPQINTQK